MEWKVTMKMLFAVTCGVICVTIADSFEYSGGGMIEERTIYRGFPIVLTCADAILPTDFNQQAHPPYSRCTIYKNGVIVYDLKLNESTDTESVGIFEEADESWKNAMVKVATTRVSDASIDSGIYHFSLEEPHDFDCSTKNTIRTEKKGVNESFTLTCYDPMNGVPSMLQVTEDMKSNYTLWWYKGCQRIEREDPNYEYVTDQFGYNHYEGTHFSDLKIKSASLTSSPGEYSCILEKNSKSNVTAEKVVLMRTQICIRREKARSYEPTIKVSNSEYIVEPGMDIKVQAQGRTGTELHAASQHVVWRRRGDVEEICHNYIDNNENPNCTQMRPQKHIFCEPARQDELDLLPDDAFVDYFTAILWIRDASEANEGSYEVTLLTTKEPVSDNFTVRLISAKPESYRWTAAVISVGILVVTASLLIVLLYKRRTDVRYILKKVFGNYQKTNKPMAFLIYAADVRRDLGKALDEAIQFFGGRRYYDPNNIAGTIESNSAGLLVHDHVVNMMRQSQRLMIFVTDSLIKGNDIENFEVYQGLEDNVRREFPVIFVCTKAMLKEIRKGGLGNINAIRAFMNIQGNCVVIWNKNNINSFKRSLYVALPKVRDIAVEG